jgi:hypothetical protein
MPGQTRFDFSGPNGLCEIGHDLGVRVAIFVFAAPHSSSTERSKTAKTNQDKPDPRGYTRVSCYYSKEQKDLLFGCSLVT